MKKEIDYGKHFSVTNGIFSKLFCEHHAQNGFFRFLKTVFLFY